MNKYIVITTVFLPTDAVIQFAQLKDWSLVAVGDRKTPSDWACDSVTFLSDRVQEKLEFQLAQLLPWNHYSRKMLGYLYAIREGAIVIGDTDDDNFPLERWGAIPDEKECNLLFGSGFVNMYEYFTNEFIWPRGLPLKYIRNQGDFQFRENDMRVGIWQYLVNGDPDVDAIYRLLFDSQIQFNNNGPFVLDKNVISPFNSQNTIFFRDVFPLLYLPATVSFRFTDILRGLVAQPILWAHDYRLGFARATAHQKRNEHDLAIDFESEIPVYLHAENVALLAQRVASPNLSIQENMLQIYSSLSRQGIVDTRELDILDAWLQDLADIM